MSALARSAKKQLKHQFLYEAISEWSDVISPNPGIPGLELDLMQQSASSFLPNI